MSLKLTIALYVATAVAGATCVHAQEQPSGNTQSSPITIPVVKAGKGITPPPSPRAVPVFKAGKGITPPRVIYQPDPEFSEKARLAHYQGTCVLSVVVGEDGKPRDIKVTRPLGMDLDEQAVEAVECLEIRTGAQGGQRSSNPDRGGSQFPSVWEE